MRGTGVALTALPRRAEAAGHERRPGRVCARDSSRRKKPRTRSGGYAEATEPALIRPLALCTDWAKKPRQIRSSALRWMLREAWLSPLLCAAPDSAAAASRIGSGLPCCQMLCPSSPTLGQLRNRKQPRHLITIARIDAKDISDGEVVIGLLHDPDLVSAPHIALDDDSEIAAGSQRLAEAAGKRFVVHPDSEPPARDSRLGNLEDRGPDPPTFAYERVVELHPFRGQVLSELAVRERAADLPLPPALVLQRIRIDGLVEAAVCLEIRLAIAREIDTASRDPSAHRRFPDRALSGPAVVVELAHATDADREDPCGFRCHGFRSSEKWSRPCA